MEFLTILVEFFDRLKDTDFLDEYRHYSSTIGRTVMVKNGREITGTAVDVNEKGQLILESKTGKKIKIYSGEILRLHQF